MWKECSWAFETSNYILFSNQPETLSSMYLFIYFPSLYVSSNPVFIIRRINCINTSSGRARSEPGGTRWRTGGEVKGKLANGVGSQYSQATSERGKSSITKADAHTSAASSRLNWRPPPIWMDSSVSGKDEIWFLRVCHHVPHELYISLCVGDCLMCRSGRDSPTHSGIYQMMYWYSRFSWWWALGSSKRVEKVNR